MRFPAIAPALGLALCLPAALEAADPRERWSEEAVWTWYRSQPWMCGFNYVPSTSSNTTEFWQAETFDPSTIDRELGWAQDIGFNSCRVFIQYLVWKNDPEGLKKRMDRFLGIAVRHGISVMPVLFDDCAFGDPPITEPFLGKQREPIPGLILPSWTPSPGLKAVEDRAAWPDLERYVKDLVGSFGADRRVIFWDLYNEPGGSGMGEKSLPLVEAVFDWARAVGPTQPLTVSVWGAGGELDRVQIARSDFPSFHAYTDTDGLRGAVARLRPYRRPVVSTEWMARLSGSRWEMDLPLLKEEAVGCYAWGLVNGRGQCQFPWWSKKGAPEPEVWFHDILRRDGTPWRPAEVESIRKTAADKRVDFAAGERFLEKLGPGVIDDADPRAAWSGPWTLWTGEGPLAWTLHYAKDAGSRCDLAFEGTGIRLIHKAGPDCGIAEILLDGKSAAAAGGGALPADPGGKALLDTFAPDVDWNREVPVAAGLAPGKHILSVLVTGRKREASTDAYVQVVGFRVEPAPAPARVLRVACLGASTMYGAGLPDREKTCIPARLQARLGAAGLVSNSGHSGATVQKAGDSPYWKTQAFQDALRSSPDLVLILLGANDSKLCNWKDPGRFEADARALIEEFRALPSRPRVVVCLIQPSFQEGEGISGSRIREGIVPCWRKAAFEARCETIDLHTPFLGRADLFPDKVHPGVEAADLMAGRIAAYLASERDPDFDASKGLGAPFQTGAFHGYRCLEFRHQDRACRIVQPWRAAPGHPWAWRAEFFGHEPQTDLALLEQGWHVVWCDTMGLMGGPPAMAAWKGFYDLLRAAGLAPKTAIIGISRGGLYAYNWAALHPETVSCIYGDAPVCDFKSWPGGKGTGKGSPEDWKAVMRHYGFKDEAEALAWKGNPVDNLEPLARAGVRLIHVVGDADTVVPVAENTAVVEARYKALGGTILVIHKPGVDHHPHSLPDPEPIVRFITAGD